MDMPSHGTKLNLVAKELRKLHQNDPAAMVIVFVQWIEIERKVSRALDAYAIPHLRMKRDDNGQSLYRFQCVPSVYLNIFSSTAHMQLKTPGTFKVCVPLILRRLGANKAEIEQVYCMCPSAKPQMAQRTKDVRILI